MLFGIEKYSDYGIFRKIERLLNVAPSFFDKKQEEFYYQVRFKQFKESLLNRFDLIAKQAAFFFIEENYTEHTWKELHALHYANTNYSYGNKVMRVHFWNSNLIEEDKIDKIDQENVKNGYLEY